MSGRGNAAGSQAALAEARVKGGPNQKHNLTRFLSTAGIMPKLGAGKCYVQAAGLCDCPNCQRDGTPCPTIRDLHAEVKADIERGLPDADTPALFVDVAATLSCYLLLSRLALTLTGPFGQGDGGDLEMSVKVVEGYRSAAKLLLDVSNAMLATPKAKAQAAKSKGVSSAVLNRIRNLRAEGGNGGEGATS